MRKGNIGRGRKIRRGPGDQESRGDDGMGNFKERRTRPKRGWSKGSYNKLWPHACVETNIFTKTLFNIQQACRHVDMEKEGGQPRSRGEILGKGGVKKPFHPNKGEISWRFIGEKNPQHQGRGVGIRMSVKDIGKRWRKRVFFRGVAP